MCRLCHLSPSEQEESGGEKLVQTTEVVRRQNIVQYLTDNKMGVNVLTEMSAVNHINLNVHQL